MLALRYFISLNLSIPKLKLVGCGGVYFVKKLVFFLQDKKGMRQGKDQLHYLENLSGVGGCT